MAAGTYSPSYSGGWGTRIAWTQEAEVAVSRDRAIALQPGWHEWNSVSKKRKIPLVEFWYSIKVRISEIIWKNYWNNPPFPTMYLWWWSFLVYFNRNSMLQQIKCRSVYRIQLSSIKLHIRETYKTCETGAGHAGPCFSACNPSTLGAKAGGSLETRN